MWFSRGHPLFHAAPSSGPAVFFASCSCWHPLNGSCQGILRPQPLWPLFPPSSLTILPSLHAAWLSLPFLALHGQPSSPLGSSGPSSVTPRLTGLLPENPFSPEPVPTPCPVCAQPSAAHTPGQYGPSVSPPPLHCMCVPGPRLAGVLSCTTLWPAGRQDALASPGMEQRGGGSLCHAPPSHCLGVMLSVVGTPHPHWPSGSAHHSSSFPWCLLIPSSKHMPTFPSFYGKTLSAPYLPYILGPAEALFLFFLTGNDGHSQSG